jgi:hypothetical protein
MVKLVGIYQQLGDDSQHASNGWWTDACWFTLADLLLNINLN